jgi:lipid-A-disaccharide synthase
MHIFISAGEPSGDLHGSNLIAHLRRLDPQARVVGFGGDKMRQAGCELLYPLCNLAVMWFVHVLRNIVTFIRLIHQADRYFRDHKPDVVVLIDYPGLHWQIARRANQRGIPVVYFVPPQLWAWAGWRVKKMRRDVKLVLATLPFEGPWYAQRGVHAEYVGHPYFDELPRQQLDAEFLARLPQPPARLVAILPGSRQQEVIHNLPTLLRAARLVHAQQPAASFLIASYNEAQAELARQTLADYPDLLGCVRVCVGRTPEVIASAEACMAVSGSVSLEMLYRLKPAVIVYRLSKLDLFVSRFFRKCRFITLVNLLADEELYPEFLADYCPAEAMAGHVLRWLNHPAEAAQLRGKLEQLRARVGQSGACERAARRIVDFLAQLNAPIAGPRQAA